MKKTCAVLIATLMVICIMPINCLASGFFTDIGEKLNDGMNQVASESDFMPEQVGDTDNDNSLDDIREILDRQDRFSTHYENEADRRLKEYWEVSITDFVLSCEEDSEAVKIITMHMKWDVENGPDMTRKMLTMYSDDMAAYLKESAPDIPIHKICIIWEVPYILEKGPVAKYLYYDAGSYMIHSESSGYLYPKN